MRMQLDLQPAWALQFREAGIPVQESQTQDILAPCFERLERGSVYSSSSTSSPSAAENRLALKRKQICDTAEFSCHTPRELRSTSDSCPKSNSTLFAPSHMPNSHFQTIFPTQN